MELLDQVFFTSMVVFVISCLFRKEEAFTRKGVARDTLAVIGLTSLAMMVICILIKIWQ